MNHNELAFEQMPEHVQAGDTASSSGTCSTCGGSGSRGCNSCGGTGKMNPGDPYSLSCSFCGGDGQVNCSSCGGSGYN